MEDFKELVSAIHEKGMKCMIDVVYNHTSHESVLSKEHPEFSIKSLTVGSVTRLATGQML